MPRLAAALVVALLVSIASAARADFATGRDKLVAGDYKTALAELAKVGGKDRTEARFLLAEAQRLTGDYAGAEATAAALAQDKDAKIAARARVAVAMVQRLTGRYADARKALEPLVAARPDDRAARHLLALVELDVGDRTAAHKLLQLSMDEFDAKKIDLDNPEQLYYLAEAARYSGQYEFANDSYREAVAKGNGYADAGIAWA